MSAPQLARLAVVGTGLIGASVALAARRAGVDAVVGWDPDAEALGVAAERDAVEPAASLANAVEGTDLVVVAAPVGDLPATVREVLDRAGDACTVTDVGSTKRPVSTAAASDARFIGGHPICGAETRGPGRAAAELFEGATWFLTPTAATDPDAIKRAPVTTPVGRLDEAAAARRPDLRHQFGEDADQPAAADVATTPSDVPTA